ncbi:hypothetical protein SAMN04489716_6350 [Actinoplanes derwentensis]|uniref:Uncharacterized protein n=1 Tax=Actinoplanes derwentensis TaxID=113562 RepID=A0A1H2CNX3_9ACTN|nr:hypothetical protein SAMN04489716_6350 [Actinoplanes derwentensis]
MIKSPQDDLAGSMLGTAVTTCISRAAACGGTCCSGFYDTEVG